MTQHERILSMDVESFADFLLQVAESGPQYFTDTFCLHCKVPNCPPENGCLYTPQDMIRIWLRNETN